jgi:tetratricopeptide (TPR) repeat protein
MFSLLAATFVAAVGPVSAKPSQPAASGQTAPPKLSKEWKRARSTNFVAVGDAPEWRLGGVLADLEAFRWAFLRLHPSLRLTSPVPTIVVLFKDWNSFTRFQPRDGKGKREDYVAGYFIPMTDMNLMLMGSQGNDNDFARSVVFHEYTHYIMHRNLQDIPIWLDEGLAEFYSTLKVEEDQIVIGVPPKYRVATLRNVQLIPLEKELSTQAALKMFRDQDDLGRFYAEAWVLVHYLTVNDRGKRQRQLQAYVDALKNGQRIDAAFASVFQCTYDQLERELDGYVHKFQFPGFALKVPPEITASIGKAEAFTESEAEAFQAHLLVVAGARSDADKRLAEMLTRDRALPAARLSLGLLRLQQERYQDAVDVLSALVKDDPDNFAAHAYLASALVKTDKAPEAVTAAERATVLNDQSPQAWWALVDSALSAGQVQRSDQAMSRLSRLEPSVGYYHSRAYNAFELGNDQVAASDSHVFIGQAGWGHESAPYAAFLAALSHRRLGQAAEADAILEPARAVVERGSWTEKVLDFFQGKLPSGPFLAQAKDNDQRTEAHAYIGFHEALTGRSDSALTHLRWVREHGTKSFSEYGMAVAELKRLEKSMTPQ